MTLYKIINGDCREILASLVNKNTIIVTDPPFNIGYKYNGYEDRKPKNEYLKMVGGVLAVAPCVIVLYPEELIRVSVYTRKVPTRVIEWVYNSNTRRQHRSIGFYNVMPDFSKVKQPYKNPNDARVKKLIDKGSKGANIYDWWVVNQVKNVSEEKTPHPCQMPYEVMDRIIKMLPEDANIIDPFCGSGTTGVACVKNGRDFVGVEIVEEYADIAKARIAKAIDEIRRTNE